MDFSDGPFFWSRPSIRPTTFRGFPPHSPEPQVPHSKQPVKTPVKMSSTAPKVVQIPVHFVGSEPSPFQSHTASALKIQKVFRGFLVRRSMKTISAIRRDVDEIEGKISQSEALELILRDERERLRLNEMLMALLFKLDSVRGVDSGVRDCRRAVIRKAIALQERVDAIVSAVDRSEIQVLGELKDDGQQSVEAVAQTLESTASNARDSVEYSGQIEEPADFDHGSQESSEGKDAAQGEVLGAVPNSVADNYERVEEESRSPESVDGIGEVKESRDRSETKVEDKNRMDNEVGNFIMVEVDFGTSGREEEHCVEKDNDIPALDERMEKNLDTSQTETLTEAGEAENVSVKHVAGMREDEKEKTEDNKGNQELLERMIEDNQKMMNMMSQLCERNEMQTRMLNSLTKRVEQLEKAYVCHILRRKKCRHSD